MINLKMICNLITLLCLLPTIGWTQDNLRGLNIEIKGTSSVKSYGENEIVFIPWGSGENKVGLKEEQVCIQGIATQTVRYGSSKIEVDKDGNIFVFDEINSQIQKYHQQEKRLLSMPLIDKVKKAPQIIEKGTSSYHYDFRRDKDDKAIIKIMDGFNVICGTIEYTEYYKYPIAIDSKGNVYVLWDTTIVGCVGHEDEEWKLEVYKYSKEGNFLAKIKLVDNFVDKLGERNKVKVDKDGNIYQLLCNTANKKDGIHIIKWEVK